jgi:DNA-binding transcriptional regulator YiaG
MDLSAIEQLLIIRRRLKLTAAEASARWGINIKTLQSWEEGVRAPGPENVALIDKILKTESAKAKRAAKKSPKT